MLLGTRPHNNEVLLFWELSTISTWLQVQLVSSMLRVTNMVRDTRVLSIAVGELSRNGVAQFSVTQTPCGVVF